MKNPNSYRILQSSSITDLERQVNELLVDLMFYTHVKVGAFTHAVRSNGDVYTQIIYWAAH